MEFWCLTASSANPDTFTVIYRWGLCLTIIGRFFTRWWIYPFLLIPDTYFLYHFNQLCNYVRRCPIYLTEPTQSNTKRNIDLPTMHCMLARVTCIRHYIKQFINRTLLQVPWIIVLKAYNLHTFLLIYISPIYSTYLQHIQHVIKFPAITHINSPHKLVIPSHKSGHTWPWK